ncbi:PTS lactose/cellobiose transporter subunit IIA [Clostridium oceanicum]|uniref:PTS lactose/cellobiose transporter subunit IIA n=1 Tax=Clostridium oceanicum TaxID=1543 RepID=A0ABN1JLX7_9CLOT
MNELEMQILQIISKAGESKSKAFEAFKKIEDSDYEGARRLLKEAKEIDVEAHKAQTELIRKELSQDGEDKLPVTLLMVHAQDHYMTSQLARDLIEKITDIFESKEVK